MEIVHAMVRGRAVGKGQVQTCTSLAAYPTNGAAVPPAAPAGHAFFMIQEGATQESFLAGRTRLVMERYSSWKDTIAPALCPR